MDQNALNLLWPQLLAGPSHPNGNAEAVTREGQSGGKSSLNKAPSYVACVLEPGEQESYKELLQKILGSTGIPPGQWKILARSLDQCLDFLRENTQEQAKGIQGLIIFGGKGSSLEVSWPVMEKRWNLKWGILAPSLAALEESTGLKKELWESIKDRKSI